MRHTASGCHLQERLWCQVTAGAPLPRSMNTHDCGSQQTERECTPHPAHHSSVRLVSLLGQEVGKSSVRSRSFSRHPSSCCQHKWRESSSLDLSHTLLVLAPLLRLMLLVDGRELPVAIAGREGVEHPHVKECVLCIAPEVGGADVQSRLIFPVGWSSQMLSAQWLELRFR